MQLLAWRGFFYRRKHFFLAVSCFAILVSISMLLQSNGKADSKRSQVSYVAGDKAELRAEPRDGGQKIMDLPRGEEIFVEKWEENGYSQVVCGNVKGYIASSKLKTPVQVYTYSPPEKGVINADGVNLRARGDQEAIIISTLKKNAQVEVVSMVDDWYCVNADSQTGYVFKDYIDLDYKGNPLAETEYKTLRMGVSGKEVARLQQALKEAGFFEGEVNGNYGARTRNAVAAYQASLDLSSDGIADNNVQQELYA